MCFQFILIVTLNRKFEVLLSNPGSIVLVEFFDHRLKSISISISTSISISISIRVIIIIFDS